MLKELDELVLRFAAVIMSLEVRHNQLQEEVKRLDAEMVAKNDELDGAQGQIEEWERAAAERDGEIAHLKDMIALLEHPAKNV